ncbi:MAG TPA: DUF1722 domain-containing protein [Actinomycetota bacterium]|nr:DUF1722 domain-containing protein [Actinomycetota bacterium]
MRIWDLSPGYLNRGSLLGEHRELHGLHSIIVNGKKGYANHPETLRWVGALGGLIERHNQLIEEMSLRGYVDRTPLAPVEEPDWPTVFVDPPGDQIGILRRKYAGKEAGRIPLPADAQQLWAQHKYSVMARSPEECGRIGRDLAAPGSKAALGDLAADLVLILREKPGAGRLSNAVEHMWGHVRTHATPDDVARAGTGVAEMLRLTQRLAMDRRERYLVESTALSDLAVFVTSG